MKEEGFQLIQGTFFSLFLVQCILLLVAFLFPNVSAYMYPTDLALKELPSSPTVTFTVRLLVLAATVVFWIPSGAISSLLGNWSTGTMHG